MEIVRLILVMVLLVAGLASYEHMKCTMPDPYAVCASKTSLLERKQCHSIVSFALTAGL